MRTEHEGQDWNTEHEGDHSAVRLKIRVKFSYGNGKHKTNQTDHHRTYISKLFRMQNWRTQAQTVYGKYQEFDHTILRMLNKQKGGKRRVDRTRENNKKMMFHLRIGEARNPGPQNAQARQRKLGDFFVKNQRHIDSKSE
eukprot:12796885-Heterocapsa_arctica.AAC.1